MKQKPKWKHGYILVKINKSEYRQPKAWIYEQLAISMIPFSRKWEIIHIPTCMKFGSAFEMEKRELAKKLVERVYTIRDWSDSKLHLKPLVIKKLRKQLLEML